MLTSILIVFVFSSIFLVHDAKFVLKKKFNLPSIKFTTLATAANIAGLFVAQNALAELLPAPWDSNVQYEVVKSSQSDVTPVVGDLVTIRFRGTYKDVAFDDTFATDQPYFYRCGVGLIVRGLDDAVTHMHVGEKLKLRFGGEYAFKDGKPSAPGKPRIPPGATVDYEVMLEDVPGKGEDTILDD